MSTVNAGDRVSWTRMEWSDDGDVRVQNTYHGKIMGFASPHWHVERDSDKTVVRVLELLLKPFEDGGSHVNG